jgi:ankyrin repeat protein
MKRDGKQMKTEAFSCCHFGGADKDRTDLHGASPLFIAAKYGQAQSFSAMAVFIPLQKFQETLKYL